MDETFIMGEMRIMEELTVGRAGIRGAHERMRKRGINMGEILNCKSRGPRRYQLSNERAVLASCRGGGGGPRS